jgi:hypothetical protein
MISDMRELDKEQRSYRQVTSQAMQKDLVITVYKPTHEVESRFEIIGGTEEGLWEFVRTHLKTLPVVQEQDSSLEVLSSRVAQNLWDAAVSFHVARGVSIPLSASEFYAGLRVRFPERDGMFFLAEQIPAYERKRMTKKEILQLQLTPSDERTTVDWLRQQLEKRPQTYQEIVPQFLKALGNSWSKHEKPLELIDLLKDNFAHYDGRGEVPSQIHSYLSTNFKELRNLAKDAPLLRGKAADRWYMPDPNKASDLEQIRERNLLREFEEYLHTPQRKLKVFRLEAMRAGFKNAWQDKDYNTIIEVAQKIPEAILQEDPKLLMWYDQALTRTGAES